LEKVHLVFWYNRRLQTTFHASQAEDVPQEQGPDDQVFSLFMLCKCCKHIMYINKHSPLIPCCVFLHFKIFERFCFLSFLVLFFWPNYFTTDTYAKYQSELFIDIGESCSPPLPGAAAEK